MGKILKGEGVRYSLVAFSCLFLFLILTVSQLKESFFRLDDYQYIVYLSNFTNPLRFWLDPPFLVGKVHYRPLSLNLFQLILNFTSDPRIFQAVVAAFIFGGILLTHAASRYLVGSSREQVSQLIVLPVLVVVAGLSATLNESISFIAAGVHDGLMFFFCASVLYCSARGWKEKNSGTQAKLQLAAFVATVGALFSKENGLIVAALPVLFVLVVATDAESPPRSRIKQIAWALVPMLFALGVYFSLRFYATGTLLSPSASDSFSRDKFSAFAMWLAHPFVYGVLGELRPVDILIYALFFLVLPVQLAVFEKGRLAVFFVAAFLLAFVPFLASETYGYNQWGLVFAVLLLFLATGLSLAAANYSRSLWGKVLLFVQLFVVAVISAAELKDEGLFLARLREGKATFESLVVSLGHEKEAIKNVYESGQQITLTNFPKRFDKQPLIYTIFLTRFGIRLPLLEAGYSYLDDSKVESEGKKNAIIADLTARGVTLVRRDQNP